MAYLSGRPGEQQEVAVGITHDEGAGAPRLLPQGLEEIDAGRLIVEEKQFDLGRAVDGHGGAKQLLAFANLVDIDRFANQPKVDGRGDAG